MRSIIVLCLLGAAAAAAPPAPDDATAEAMRHFDEGSKLFHLGQLYRAADEYKLAYRAKPDPSFLFNVAQALRLANDFSEAIFFYRSFLAADPQTGLRREVQERITSMENELKRERSAALAPPTGTLPPNAPAAKAGVAAQSATAARASSETAAPSEDPAPTAAPSEAAARVPAAALTVEVPAPPRRRKRWPWAVVGVVAAVGVAVGVGLGVGLGDGGGAPKTQQGTIHF